VKLGGKNLNEEEEWPYVLSFLPNNLEDSAKNYRVLIRKREISSAEDLLRMLLAYSVTDLSLHSTCVWASAVGIASLSKPAFFYRVRDSTEWLLYLLAHVLNQDTENPEGDLKHGIKIQIVDATHIQGPGAEGSEWRIHTRLAVDPGGKSWRMTGIKITDELVGENYGIHEFGPAVLAIGDRGYGTAKGIYYAREVGTHVLVRISADSIRVCSIRKNKMLIKTYEKEVPEQGCYSKHIQIPVPPGRITKSKKTWPLEKTRAWIPARLIGFRNDKEEVVWLITTLPDYMLDDLTAMNLYRIRWQIELLFKRLKSLAWLDRLPAPRKGPTAMIWIAARLLGAALVETINSSSISAIAAENDGCDYELDPEERSVWREFHIGLWAIRALIIGHLINFFFSREARALAYSSRRKRKLQNCTFALNAHPPPN
jgi:hypothetical protein